MQEVTLISVLGFLIVFAVLFVIYLGILFLGKALSGLAYATSGRPEKKAGENVKAEQWSKEEHEEELLAVISAALYQELQWDDEAQIVSIKER